MRVCVSVCAHVLQTPNRTPHPAGRTRCVLSNCSVHKIRVHDTITNVCVCVCVLCSQPAFPVLLLSCGAGKRLSPQIPPPQPGLRRQPFSPSPHSADPGTHQLCTSNCPQISFSSALKNILENATENAPWQVELPRKNGDFQTGRVGAPAWCIETSLVSGDSD